MNKIIYNAIRTPDGTVLVSRHRHDYKTHIDSTNGKEYMVDGGFEYLRRNAQDDYEELSRYDDEPFEVRRQIVAWGTRGKDGLQPLKYVVVAEMETEHIEAVLYSIAFLLSSYLSVQPDTKLAGCK